MWNFTYAAWSRTLTHFIGGAKRITRFIKIVPQKRYRQHRIMEIFSISNAESVPQIVVFFVRITFSMGVFPTLAFIIRQVAGQGTIYSLLPPFIASQLVPKLISSEDNNKLTERLAVSALFRQLLKLLDCRLCHRNVVIDDSGTNKSLCVPGSLRA